MNKKYVDEEMMVMYESAQTLFELGLIDAAQMKEFDQDCLIQEEKTTPAAGVSRNKTITPAFTNSRH
jgi:DNA-binding transcriptional regulator YiaG